MSQLCTINGKTVDKSLPHLSIPTVNQDNNACSHHFRGGRSIV